MQVKTSVLLLLTILCFLSYISFALNQEGLYLQRMKLSLSDPSGFLSGWSDRDPDPCNWTGVTCNGQGSVVSVILTGASLSGSFPISLCRLPSLSKLSLSNNDINSSLPLSISSCRNLAYLDLSQNLLAGPLPSTLSDLHFLRYLNLEGNSFSGEIPATFGLFRQLESLTLTENLLDRTIPAVLGNITSLKKLALAYNPFSQGELPPELGNLTNLEYMWLADCNIVGSIPDSFGGLRRLKNLDLSNNGLTGRIPSVLSQLKSIVQVELYNNSFTGTLALSWSNLTNLRRFDASMNSLIGPIPEELCELPLESLNLFENKLEGLIPESIAKSPNLYDLKLFRNELTGSLPRELGKNSALQTLDVSYSNLSGEVPEFLCHNGALEEIVLINNAFSGKIPTNLGECRSLRRVRLGANRFYGEIPPLFWGLPHVYLLDLYENSFSGNISHLIYGAKNLSTLNISNNKFSGGIPNEIGSLDSLVEFLAHDNELGGEIPSPIVNMKQLGRLDLSNNDLSGGIPKGIQSMKQLNELNLANNRLSGHIPDELGNLMVLNYLDLSKNNFSGEIPLSLQNLKLNELNLSSNLLSGDIPPLFANGVYKDSFLGNPGLCVHNSGLCNPRQGKTSRVFSWILRSIFIIAGLVFLVGLVWFLLKYKKLEKIKNGSTITKWTSFHKLGFSEFEISYCLKEANVIGRGASGKVYKVILSNGETVAVKKLHERPNNNENDSNSFGSDKHEFEVEVETLGKIRHKNIVRLWCCCITGSCKLLVYEYMPNGSLGDLLHSNKKRLLDWPIRFKIALDAAEGLSYLHHDCVPPIVHRDVKSNNILLDEDFGAKISDFGVAKVVKAANRGVESMSVIAGSCGYIAPEYAYTLRVNEKSDIYSFGIVILELITGKSPIDPEFGEKDLATWVCTKLDQHGIGQVVDPELDSRFNEHICRVLDIGLLCTSSLPINRPSMRRVVNMMQELSATMPCEQEKDGKIFPSF
ncbi:Serine/threonine protein kinase [Handroanthus impetiginosus]|uniref:non-specific serine/threonine protein kinase n=1 Tax=Handroanthus impetiginosus TaxID=429701 RepID=A0A2G9GFK9_9LAMI|nr:Serine/threonine protein kinase [Handroanthus impetiginosus]